MTTETILTTQEILHEYHGTDTDLDFARAIEQAVLQSPEIQALRKDAGRYKWLKDQFRILSLDMGGKHSWALQRPIREGSTIDEVCDAAMEQQE